MMADQCVFIRGFRAKRIRFRIRPIRIGSSRDLNANPQRPYRIPLHRNDGLSNTLDSLGSSSSLNTIGSSASLDAITPVGSSTIGPPINHENPQRSPYQTLQINDSLRNTFDSLRGSSSSLDTIRPGDSTSSSETIRPPINHENPQLLPYSSSTTLQSNGSVFNASYMTSPSYDSFDRSL